MTPHERWTRLTELCDRIARRYRMIVLHRPTDAKRTFERLRSVALAAEAIAREDGLPCNYYVRLYDF